MAKEKKAEVHVPTFLRDAVAARLDDADGMLAFPRLAEFVTPVWQGKTCCYIGGTIRIKVEGAQYAVVLDSPTAGVQTRFYLPSLDGLLQAIDLALDSNKLVWVPSWKPGKKAGLTVDDVVE